jgi:NAD(P) transhydrogenase subunit beta
VVIGSAIGGVSARRVKMTAMPQMVAVFNGCGGAASALVAVSEYHRVAPEFELFLLTTMLLSIIIGSLTFTGSLIAFAKLQELIGGKPTVYRGQQFVNAALGIAMIALAIGVGFAPADPRLIYGVVLIALALGVLFVIPIGGADMPVVISLLNSYSGLAVAMTGFLLMNNALIIVGSLVGAAGMILTIIMCDAMNRSLANVLFGAFGAVEEAQGEEAHAKGAVKAYTVEDAAIVLENASNLIIVPGYGMAASHAQYAVRDLAEVLEEMGVDVRYAIHPVAGRMPGHMNVLLAEADVSYDKLYPMEDINDDFPKTDAVLVIGANDVVNPAAKNTPSSPIYGMPVLNVELSKTVMVLKRSMRPGFAGIENELFYMDNTMMIFGDAKDTLTKIMQQLKQ